MVERTKTRRGYCSIPAVNPADGTLWDVLVPNDKMDYVAKRGPIAVNEMAWIMPTVLNKPVAIFSVPRDEGDEGLCYVGQPGFAFKGKQTAQKTEPWPGEVYVVYVNAERVVYDWRWEDADPGDPQLPEGHEHRYDRLVL